MAVATAPAPREQKNTGPATGANPFTKAARRKTETFLDRSDTLSASTKTMQQIDIPATGYLRHVWLMVEVSAPAGATALKADAPWNVIESLTFRDVNGQPLHVLSGYDLFLANLFGAYCQNADPRKANGYSAAFGGAGIKFMLRVPVEIIARGALGCLPNTNGSMLYKLAITLAARDTVFTGATADPTVRIRGVVESWSNPAPADLRGVPNVTQPPSLGVTQNWSEYVAPVVNGQNTIRLPRVGNSIRNLLLVLRDGTGARVDAWPTELGIYIDGNQWHKAPVDYHKQRACELYGYAPADIPAGVLVFPFTDDFDGTPGEEVGDFWIQTSGATRLEVQGTFSAAGNVMVLTNDVLAVAAPSGPGQTLGAGN